MHLCLVLLVTAAALSHAAQLQTANSEGYNAAGITSSNFPKDISKKQSATIENVVNALGSSDITKPKLDSNPNPPPVNPVVKAPQTVSAEWHNIARPAGANCAVRAWLRQTACF